MTVRNILLPERLVSDLLSALSSAIDYFDSRADAYPTDTSYGVPEANEEMRAASELGDLYDQLERLSRKKEPSA